MKIILFLLMNTFFCIDSFVTTPVHMTLHTSLQKKYNHCFDYNTQMYDDNMTFTFESFELIQNNKLIYTKSLSWLQKSKTFFKSTFV